MHRQPSMPNKHRANLTLNCGETSFFAHADCVNADARSRCSRRLRSERVSAAEVRELGFSRLLFESERADVVDSLL